MKLEHLADMPLSVDVMGKSYRLEADDKLLEKDCRGLCLNITQAIVLHPEYHSDNVKETSLHEVMHALEWAGELDLKERDIATLSKLLFGFLRANPNYVEWLMRRATI